jgi:hypothetical protein
MLKRLYEKLEGLDHEIKGVFEILT